jgi:plastocyanin
MKQFVLVTLSLLLLSSCNSTTDSTTGATDPSGNPIVVTPPIVEPATPITITIEPGCIGEGPLAYGVNPLKIPLGTVVTWINADAVTHTATDVTHGTFDSMELATGESYSYTFTVLGTYEYEDVFYGFPSMSGEIQVFDPSDN